MTIYNYDAARAWARRGYNAVPQKAIDKKHPAVKCKHLQTRKVADAELQTWKSMFENGVGCITGAISGVIVIDTDGPEGEAVLAEYEKLHGPLPNTLTIRSGSGRGLHRHFKHPGYRVKTVANPAIKLDIKGDGGFCVLPPSLHKSGGRYAIINNVRPAPLPDDLLEFIEMKARQTDDTTRCMTSKASPARERPTGLGDNTNRFARVPINARNVALVQSMLDAIPEEFAENYDQWLRVGFALHDFDEGKIGLALWTRFSRRCPEKAGGVDFARAWNGFGCEYAGRKVTIGWLRAAAEDHGWRSPCRWDRSTNNAA